MSIRRIEHLVPLVLVLIAIAQSQPPPVTQRCLDCICQSSSNCDLSKRCHTAPNGGYFCGPYQISWPYWADGGRLGDRGHPNDFESCLNNKVCAEATIVGYMSKWAQDCNGDGRVDCIDFAAIHVTGGTNCRPDWLPRSQYWKAFQRTQCFREAGIVSRPVQPRSFNEPSERVNTNRPSVQPPNNFNEPSRPRSPPPPAAVPRRHPFNGNNRPTPPPDSRPFHDDHSDHGSQPSSVGRGNANDDRRVSWGTFPNTSTVAVLSDDGVLTLVPAHRVPADGGRPHNQPPPNNVNNRRAVFEPDSNRGRDFRRPEFDRPNINLPGPTNNDGGNFNRAPPQPNNRGDLGGNRGGREFNPDRRPFGMPDISLPPGRPAGPPPVDRPQPQPSRPFNEAPNNRNQPPINVPTANGPVSTDCLSCLCRASSGCDLNRQCHGEFCGPYLITWSYWRDGGSPGGDYVRCALDKRCAEAAIQGYMKKWSRDCNGDGIVDCDDYAAIHKNGPHQCREESVTATDYWREYEKCPSSGSSGFDPRNSRSPNDRRGAESSPNHFNVPHSLNTSPREVNSISLPVTKPPPRSWNNPNPFFDNDRRRPNSFGFTTPRPDLPLITPRRTIAARRSEDFWRGRAATTATEKPPIEITSECMSCICEANSGCDFERKCSGPPDAQVCGAYQLDRNYWTAAGFQGSQFDFERCAGQKDCAEETVRRYLTSKAFDCNEDGTIDCLDLASIHKSGPKSCNAQWFLESPYWSEFQQCYGFGR